MTFLEQVRISYEERGRLPLSHANRLRRIRKAGKRNQNFTIEGARDREVEQKEGERKRRGVREKCKRVR